MGRPCRSRGVRGCGTPDRRQPAGEEVRRGDERDRLDGNNTCITKNKSQAIFVIGHTDTSGTDEYNIALSERRAQSVADYLARLGTDPAKMQVVPKGETEPSGLGDDKDRRVEFKWK